MIDFLVPEFVLVIFLRPYAINLFLLTVLVEVVLTVTERPLYTKKPGNIQMKNEQ
jgi:hypothetical protein